MSLSSAEKDRNFERLTIIEAKLLSVIDVSLSEKLAMLKVQTEKFLDERNILLSMRDSEDALQMVLANALVNEADLQKDLQNWAANHKKLEAQATAKNQAMANAQAQGIAYHLHRDGSVPPRVEGTDADMRLLLKNEFSHSDKITENGSYILPPVILTANSRSSQMEKNHPELALRAHVGEALYDKDNKPRNLKHCDLLIPVNLLQSDHWCLVRVEIRKGNVSGAMLLDPATNPKLAESEGFANLKKALDGFVDESKLSALALHRQTDTYTCMDHVTQLALEYKYPEGGIPHNAYLEKIRVAEDAQELREAVIAGIAANNQVLVVGSPANANNQIKAVFLNPPQSPSDLEQAFFEALTSYTNDEEEKQTRELQESFDELMAKNIVELEKSYATQHIAMTEADLLNEARSQASKQLKESLAKRGFFAEKKSKKVTFDPNVTIHEIQSNKNKH